MGPFHNGNNTAIPLYLLFGALLVIYAKEVDEESALRIALVNKFNS